MLDRGDVVVVPFPYTDLTSSKLRPALVLTDRAHNERTGDLVVCAMTSNLANSPWSVLLDDADLSSGKLVAPSRVKVDKLQTIHHTVVRKRVGTLRPAAMRRIWKEFHSLVPHA